MLLLLEQVLLGVGSAITVVDEDSAQDHTQLLGSSSVTTMAVSPNGQFLAAFTQDGRLIVLLADLTRTLSEFSTQSDAQPDQMGWCGTDSVVLVWKVRVLHDHPKQPHVSSCPEPVLPLTEHNC